MSKINNGGLDQYGAEPFEQQQFGTAGVEWLNHMKAHPYIVATDWTPVNK